MPGFFETKYRDMKPYRLLIAFILLLSGVVVISIIKTGPERKAGRYERFINAASMRYDVDPNLVKAVIMQESRFNEDATGKDQEIGLMQITPLAVKDWERAQNRRIGSRGIIFVPDLNIEIGTWYLATAIQQWHHQEHTIVWALTQYNAGRSRALKWTKTLNEKNIIENIQFKSTRNYIRSVLKYYSKFSTGQKHTNEDDSATAND